jgi:hypothetical protein
MTQSAVLSQVLNAFDRKAVLGVLSYVQERRARDEVLQGLLQAPLVQLVAEPEPLLTAVEVAKRLSVEPGRV